MITQWLVSLAAVMFVVSLAPGRLAAQTPAAPMATTSNTTWTLPRTPDGKPDLQGIWANDTSTPLERPSAFAGKDVLTDDEVAEVEKRGLEARNRRDSRDQPAGTVTDVARAYNAHWFPIPGKAINRPSLIVDPADGKVPPMTPAAVKRFAAWAEATGRVLRGEGRAGGEGAENGAAGGQDGEGRRADNPEDRNPGERCISNGLPRLPGGYNNFFRIVQTPEYVVIEIEMQHHSRIIPLDGRPHFPQTIRQWMGDPRGHWEGDTLVVDTTNFAGKHPFRGSFEGLHLVERFTRIDEDTINYEFTVDDPTTWTRAWTASFPLTSLRSAVGGVDGINTPEIFEYACHEGNYGLPGQLRGQRAVEKAGQSEKAKQ